MEFVCIVMEDPFLADSPSGWLTPLAGCPHHHHHMVTWWMVGALVLLRWRSVLVHASDSQHRFQQGRLSVSEYRSTVLCWAGYPLRWLCGPDSPLCLHPRGRQCGLETVNTKSSTQMRTQQEPSDCDARRSPDMNMTSQGFVRLHFHPFWLTFLLSFLVSEETQATEKQMNTP